MSRFLAFVLAGFAAGTAIPAGATPLYYTFSGEVTFVNDASVATELHPGSDVTYTFLVDFAGEGSATQFGSTLVYQDVSNGNYDSLHRYSVDYFRVDYVSGDAVSLPGAGSPFRENMGSALTIWDRFDPSYVYYYGSLNASVQTDFYNVMSIGRVLFQDPSAHPQSWGIGTPVEGFDRIIAQGGYLEVRSNLTLDRISEVAPAAVPEPGSLLLVAPGLMIFAVACPRQSGKDPRPSAERAAST